MKIIGANGIGNHGEQNIDLLLRVLSHRGFDVHDCELPWVHWMRARFYGCPDGLRIASNSKDGDIVVAHSFGCYRAWNAHLVRDYKAIVCIAPAMERDVEWRHPERVTCWHSHRDRAVKIGALLRFHPFGPAGNEGFDQEGVCNYRVDAGHNDYFKGSLLHKIADHIETLARR